MSRNALSRFRHTCPACNAQVSTDLPHARVWHRCPRLRSNPMTLFIQEGPDDA